MAENNNKTCWHCMTCFDRREERERREGSHSAADSPPCNTHLTFSFCTACLWGTCHLPCSGGTEVWRLRGCLSQVLLLQSGKQVVVPIHLVSQAFDVDSENLKSSGMNLLIFLVDWNPGGFFSYCILLSIKQHMAITLSLYKLFLLPPPVYELKPFSR